MKNTRNKSLASLVIRAKSIRVAFIHGKKTSMGKLIRWVFINIRNKN